MPTCIRFKLIFSFISFNTSSICLFFSSPLFSLTSLYMSNDHYSDSFLSLLILSCIFSIFTCFLSATPSVFGSSRNSQPTNAEAVVRLLLVTASVVTSSLILVTLMMEVLSSSETSVLTRIVRRNITEDAILLLLTVLFVLVR
jgi:hypothetical protein